MRERGPGIGKITILSAPGSGAQSQRQGEWTRLSKISANKSSALQLRGGRSCIWQPCFSADCDRLRASAGISLGGSKDSRLFPCFSEMTDVRAQLPRSGGAHSSWAGESWRALQKEAAAAASCYATIPVFSKGNVWVY